MKKKVLAFIFIGILSIGLVACTPEAQTDATESSEVVKEITDEEKEREIGRFLTSFFTLNRNGRYDILMEKMENDDSIVDVDAGNEGIIPLPEAQLKAMETYYAEFEPYVTQECLETMQANRLPVQLERFVKEKGILDQASAIKVGSDDAENTFWYEVEFEVEEGELYFTEPLKGQVTIEIVDGEVKVSAISIVQ